MSRAHGWGGRSLILCCDARVGYLLWCLTRMGGPLKLCTHKIFWGNPSCSLWPLPNLHPIILSNPLLLILLLFLLSWDNNKKRCLHSESQIFMLIMIFGFPIELQKQNLLNLDLLYIILTLCCSLTAGKEMKKKNTRNWLLIINQNFPEFTSMSLHILLNKTGSPLNNHNLSRSNYYYLLG